MPPPTQIMAAVPTALRIVRNTGISRTRARPSARPIPARTEAPSLLARAIPKSSAFTISATRDPAHDRQFALGSKSDHVTRRNRRIVDDDARSLCPRLRGLAGDIIEVGCRHLCDRRKIVKKGDQGMVEDIITALTS